MARDAVTLPKFKHSVVAAATLCLSCMNHSFQSVILNAQIANQIAFHDFNPL